MTMETAPQALDSEQQEAGHDNPQQQLSGRSTKKPSPAAAHGVAEGRAVAPLVDDTESMRILMHEGHEGSHKDKFTDDRIRHDDTEDPALSPTETRAVFWLKVFLLVILTASTVGVALLVYFYSSEAEKTRFEERFEDEASKIVDAVGGSFFLSLSAIDAHVLDLVSHAESSSSLKNWPFVTLPHHAAQASKVRSLSKTFVMTQYPLVTNATRGEWEAFSVQNDGWVDEALEVQKGDVNFHGTHLTDYERSEKLHGNSLRDPQGRDTYLPAWTSYPVVPYYPPYNWDGSDLVGESDFEEIFERKHVVAEISNLPDLDTAEAIDHAETTNKWAESYIRNTDDASEPFITVYYPIATDNVAPVSSPSITSGSVVGMLAVSIYWKELLQDILQPGTGGITAVFEVGDRVFTYAIDGPETTFLGRGDQHDTRFDRLELAARFLDVQATAKGDWIYTGLPLSASARSSTVRIYPSAGMESYFVSNDPVIYTVVVVLAFAFTSALLVIYDRLRSNALEKATHTAQESIANVALLEKMVKERTHELETTNSKLEEANRRVVGAAEAQLSHFACMSHEIRTPLNCVIGMSSLLQDSDLTPMQAESMKMITTSGELLLSIVNDVLDFSKLETGNVEIHVKRSNLQESLSSIVHSMNVKGEERHVRVRTIYDPSVPEFIDTDSRRLSQVLFNIIANSIKFSREGGTVEFSVSIIQDVEEAQSITDNSSKYSPPRQYQGQPMGPLEGTVIRFVVKDYGRGIKRDDFPKIFRPFRQADQNTESLYGGTGLGLSITSKLVHGLGGSISVESVEREWSAFTVDLPLNETQVDTSAIAAGLDNATVLLVGCETSEQERMADILRGLNVDCACFAGFQELVDTSSFHEAVRPSTERTHVFVMNEDMYNQEAYSLLSSQITRSILITVGPRFRIKEARKNYSSLTHVLPSIILSDIARYVQAPAYEKTLSKRHILESTGHATAPAFQKMRYLIAEDNLVNQKVLSRFFLRLGIENFEIVDNGAKAVEREAAEPFDCILMDMQMPIMSGTEAAKLISARPENEETPHPKAKVIFCTAHALEHIEQECLDAGAVGFLTKPCTIKGVEACLRKVLGEGG